MLYLYYLCLHCRKVIESAESMLRNKCVQPMSSLNTAAGQGQRRKVQLATEISKPDIVKEQDDGKSSSCYRLVTLDY